MYLPGVIIPPHVVHGRSNAGTFHDQPVSIGSFRLTYALAQAGADTGHRACLIQVRSLIDGPDLGQKSEARQSKPVDDRAEREVLRNPVIRPQPASGILNGKFQFYMAAIFREQVTSTGRYPHWAIHPVQIR